MVISYRLKEKIEGKHRWNKDQLQIEYSSLKNNKLRHKNRYLKNVSCMKTWFPQSRDKDKNLMRYEVLYLEINAIAEEIKRNRKNEEWKSI